jgi:6-phosphogluconate dehydrogenase
MHLLAKASAEFNYDLKLHEIARIWKGGCIIRAAFLDVIYKGFDSNRNLQHLLLEDQVQTIVRETTPAIREVTTKMLTAGISIPSYLNALSYFDALRSENMPSNLIQAQRDYFGAHTYELIGQEGSFHSDWKMEQGVITQNVKH